MELVLDRLTKQFGPKIAVDRVSAELSPGVHGLLGANGAGKTTLMRMICDVLRPTSGQVLFDGGEVHAMGDRYRARLGYLPQDFGYYPGFSALDFMEYMAALKGVEKRLARSRCLNLLETVGLRDEVDAKVGTFSGGMKRRLGIAQAVLNDPEVLVLDEPTAGLDPKERAHFRNIIANLAQDRVVLLSTHIVSDVEHIAGDILVMRSGAFIMRGSPEEVLGNVAGKVWECRADAEVVDKLTAALTVCNTRFFENGRAVIRFVADEIPEQVAQLSVTSEEPTLEDLYLYVFRDREPDVGKIGDSDGSSTFGHRSCLSRKAHTNRGGRRA